MQMTSAPTEKGVQMAAKYFCVHSDGLGRCEMIDNEYCVEGPCPHEKIVEYAPVVRCKDCKKCMLWRKPTDGVIGECYIRKMNSDDEQFCLVGADDFCSYGERKDGEG